MQIGKLRHERRLQPLLHLWHNNCPVRQQYDEKHILDWSFNRVRKADQPKRSGRCPKILRFQCSDLYVIKGRHKVGSDLSRFLFRLWRQENSVHQLQSIFKCSTVLGGTSVIKTTLPTLLERRQQEGEQDCSEPVHRSALIVLRHTPSQGQPVEKSIGEVDSLGRDYTY